MISSWATPAASEAGGTPEQFLARKEAAASNGSKLGISLTSLSLQSHLTAWSTPRTEDGESSGVRWSRGRADTLTAQTRLFSSWPTPIQGDHRPGMVERGLETRGNLNDRAALAAWPTPLSSDMAGAMSPEAREAQRARALPRSAGGPPGGSNLRERALLAAWPTPMVRDDKGSQTGTELYSHNSRPLNETAKMLASWSTPLVADAQGSGPNQNSTSLDRQARDLTGPARLTADGLLLTGSSAGMPSGGQLNPALSRWLIGLPEAWDRAAPVGSKVTAGQSSRRKRQRSSKPTSKRALSAYLKGFM